MASGSERSPLASPGDLSRETPGAPRTDAFTSISLNYLAKARVLGRSLAEHHPEIHLHLMLCDEVPDWFDLEKEPFESVMTIEDLGIEDWKAWAFQHSVVELCTAVKPFAFRSLLAKWDSGRLFYFDPDLVFFSNCDGLFRHLEEASILLTPHVSEPDADPEGIVDNEISSMAHGIYNLGFLGIRNDPHGRRLIDWWCDRLLHFCHDDIPRGLFTDQRWMDFVPAFFDRCRIIRDPEYNVATWNYSTRSLSGSREEGFLVNGRPLGFHHFSGVDNGASEMMLAKYARDVPAAWALDAWYREECRRHGQAEVERLPWRFGRYENGETIERPARILYRRRAELRQTFPDPFAVVREGGRIACYRDWLRDPKNAEALVLMDAQRPPFGEFLRHTFRVTKVYARNTPRLSSWQRRVVLGALNVAGAICRLAARVMGIK